MRLEIIDTNLKLVDSRTKSLKIQKKLEDTSAQLRASYEAARDGIIVVELMGILSLPIKG